MKTKLKTYSKVQNRKNQKKHIPFIVPIVILLSVAALSGLIVAMTQKAMPKTPVVCLDAGHGGDDVGAIGESNRYEKDDNLKLTLLVAEKLKADNIRVILTRDDDTFISLDNRCKIANRKKATLFVALHRNSADSGSGVEIWAESSAPENGMLLADNILAKLDEVGISKNRGVKTGIISNANGDYYVNKHTDMPSCLVEMGFITSDDDNKLFDDNLDKYASAIADGICETLSVVFEDNKQ